MRYIKLVILSVLVLLFVSCGSGIKGTYTLSLFGLERGYKFAGNGKVTHFSSVGGEQSGTYTFDSTSNDVHIEWDNGESIDLKYNPSTKTITELDAEGFDVLLTKKK